MARVAPRGATPVIAMRFPRPPPAIIDALNMLQKRQPSKPVRPFWNGGGAELERPWEPASCGDELSATVWSWCRDVVAWINHEYVWRPADMVPACWPRHAHIAREVPVLAVLRWEAENAIVPDLTENWNRYTFPQFWDRMVERLGESTCRTGKHQDWPAESRYASSLNASPAQP
jgi:hypothetical protein